MEPCTIEIIVFEAYSWSCVSASSNYDCSQLSNFASSASDSTGASSAQLTITGNLDLIWSDPVWDWEELKHTERWHEKGKDKEKWRCVDWWDSWCGNEFFPVQNGQVDNYRKASTTSVQLASIDEHSGMLLFFHAFIQLENWVHNPLLSWNPGIGPRFKWVLHQGPSTQIFQLQAVDKLCHEVLRLLMPHNSIWVLFYSQVLDFFQDLSQKNAQSLRLQRWFGKWKLRMELFHRYRFRFPGPVVRPRKPMGLRMYWCRSKERKSVCIYH